MRINKQTIFNSIKFAIASTIAIIITMILELEYAVSAGLLTILTIQPTKKETLSTAASRIISFILALGISFTSFKIFGCNMKGYIVYLVIFIFVCQICGWYSSIVANSVMISHFMISGNMGLQMLINELGIFTIGIGLGVVANLHLHKDVDYIEALKSKTDEQVKRILARMSERILNNDMSDYNGECFEILRERIRIAKNVAESNYNNQIGSGGMYDMNYIKLCDEQYRILYEMYEIVRQMDMTPHTAKKISDFLKKLSNEYHKKGVGDELLQEFYEMDKGMKSEPLPVYRQEFENRARLFALLRHIEAFIDKKIKFEKSYQV